MLKEEQIWIEKFLHFSIGLASPLEVKNHCNRWRRKIPQQYIRIPSTVHHCSPTLGNENRNHFHTTKYLSEMFSVVGRWIIKNSLLNQGIMKTKENIPLNSNAISNDIMILFMKFTQTYLRISDPNCFFSYSNRIIDYVHWNTLLMEYCSECTLLTSSIVITCWLLH